MLKSKEILEQLTGREIRHFSYPDGNFNDAISAMVRNKGFISAVTTEPGFFKNEADPFSIKRFGINANTTIDFFRAKLTGIFELARLFYRG